MKSIFVIAAAMGMMVSSAAFAVQGPPSMSPAQAAAYAACVKKTNAQIPDFSDNQVPAKAYFRERCYQESNGK